MSGSGKKLSKKEQADLAMALIAGIKKFLATAPQLTVGGQNLTPAAVEAQLQALATIRSEVVAAKTAWDAKLSVERAKAPALEEFLTAFVSFVRGTFGNSPETLAAFGLKPIKARRTLSSEELAAKAAKAAATRKARGTKGKKQKLEVQGDVVGVVVTPITSTSKNPESAPVTAPATTSPSGGSK